MKHLLIAGLFLLPAFALAFEEADDKALAEVQALLQNPEVLKGPAGNQKEKAALAEIEKLTKGDPKAQQEINQLSSDIFTKMVQTNGAGEGDIMKALLEAQQNPGKFMQSLSPEQQKKIRDLASEIDKKNEQTNKQK
jgi:anion-transporting  ArsA/GET3 family ATPase